MFEILNEEDFLKDKRIRLYYKLAMCNSDCDFENVSIPSCFVASDDIEELRGHLHQIVDNIIDKRREEMG